MKILIELILLIVFISISFSSPQDESFEFQQVMDKIFVQNQCQIPPKQQKVAIWTMTRLRVGKKSLQDAIYFFDDYLTRYAESQCDAFESIYLIWNNDQSPEFYGFTANKNKWKKKVYFLHTESNNLDFRYIVPQWVKEDVLINLDDDAVITCEGIRNSLQQYNQRSIGSFGPIGGTLGRTVNFNKYINEFQNLPVYVYAPKTIYNYVLPGLAILSKHTAELYYSRIFQFQKLRSITQKLMNCEDIAANFMTNSLYDDVQSFFVKGMQGKLIGSNFQLSHHPEFENERKRCGYWFTKIFGYNPNELVYEIDSYSLKQKRDRPMQNVPCLTLMKKRIIQNKYFTHEHYYLNLIGVYGYGLDQNQENLLSQENKLLRLSRTDKKQLIQKRKVDIKYKSKYSLESLFSFQGQSDGRRTNKLYQKLKSVMPYILEKKLMGYQDKLQNLQLEYIESGSISTQIKSTKSKIYQLKQLLTMIIIATLLTIIKIVLNLLNKPLNNEEKETMQVQQALEKEMTNVDQINS